MWLGRMAKYLRDVVGAEGLGKLIGRAGLYWGQWADAYIKDARYVKPEDFEHLMQLQHLVVLNMWFVKDYLNGQRTLSMKIISNMSII